MALAALVTAGSAGAQLVPLAAPVEDPKAKPLPTDVHEIEARRTALAAELVAHETALESSASGADRTHLEAIHSGLRAIGALLERQAELSTPAATSPRSAPHEPDEPVSLLALDRLYEARVAHAEEGARLSRSLAARREALAAAKEKLVNAERDRRAARGQLEELPQSAQKRTVELRDLASRVAREELHLRTLEAAVAERALGEWESVAEPGQRIERMRDALARGAGDAAAVAAELARREGELRRSRGAADRKLSTTLLRLEVARKRFSERSDPPEHLLEEVEALTVERDVARLAIERIDARLERLAIQRTTWERWDAVLQGRSNRQQLEAWKAEQTEQLEAIRQLEIRHQGLGEDIERRIQSVQRRLRSIEDERAREPLENQRSGLVSLLDAERSELAELGHERRTSERLLTELRERTGEWNLVEHVSAAFDAVVDLWRYEITAVDDASITVGSLVLALVLAGIGLWASRRGSALIARLAMERFRVDAGAAHAFQTLSFYVLLVGFTLLALRAIHFPLTAFTVLGGALAIGIGFGSQNVMNNFISGLILMLERPVRARDVVEVEGNHGTVERIGARSTQIRSQDGRQIIVPNSFFLESNVVNWTLSDELVRSSVKVGVVYGSPTRLVESLIRGAVEEDEGVLDLPKPLVIFNDFGDNSLNFEAHFWVRARSPMEMRIVQSRLRFRIDDLFREHDLVIAFPQRDVHLDSVAPIEVRVVDRDATPHDSRRADAGE